MSFEVYDPLKHGSGHHRGGRSDVYSLKVYQGDEPDPNPERSWTIRVRGDQNLRDLHAAIEAALGRFEDHPYGFVLATKTSDDRIDIAMYGTFGRADRAVTLDRCSPGDRFVYQIFPAPGQEISHIVEVMDVSRADVHSRTASAPPEPADEGRVAAGEPVYTFKVYLGKKLKKRPRVWRTIAIRGDQTLDDLHNAIFDAFDRWDEHLYSFYLRGEEFTAPAEEPAVPGLFAGLFGSPGKDAGEAVVNELGLGVGDWFTYLFDFGDEWWHVVELVGTEEKGGLGAEYPVVLERRGESPPQYPDIDEEWEE